MIQEIWSNSSVVDYQVLVLGERLSDTDDPVNHPHDRLQLKQFHIQGLRENMSS